jgi:threonine dehydrogenase-like Zn-dependent dehydrogenase
MTNILPKETVVCSADVLLVNRQALVDSPTPNIISTTHLTHTPLPHYPMEETTVVIVGAGPSGLALGALLGRMNVKARRHLVENTTWEE